MKTALARYLSLVKFFHTVFALPFALTGYAWALTAAGYPFDGWVLAAILACMVLARNAAMGFNRWADRKIDAANPRTAGRDIPAGRISPRAALLFTLINAAGFLVVAGLINRLTLILAPVALFILLGYSYTKRFTAGAHLVLGTALGIAPVGAYVAVTGELAYAPIVLSGLVITWVAGFDILYAMQDARWDAEHGLHSVPVRFSPRGAAIISLLLHVVTLYAAFIFGHTFPAGALYWIGAGLFAAQLVVQHLLYTPSRVDHIGASFGLMNGVASLTFALFAIADLVRIYC